MSNPFDPGYYASEELRSFGFRNIGEKVQIAKNCTIIGLANISIGNHVRIDGFTTMIAASGTIELGSYIHIGGYCHLSGGGGILMEDFSGLSQGTRIYSASDDYSGSAMTNPTVPAQFTNATFAPVQLGRHVIIGSGTIILPGVTVCEGSSVGALSLVRKSLPPWGVYSGAPARRISERSRQLLELERQFLTDQAALPSGGNS